MLDNLGFGEIAMLALMALLFFGPERLPQIGARVGHWIATLTQSSKAFMNEWRDEALVVYDAVEEVKGIRDEIFAARAEIASTMTTARDDVNDALTGARADVQAQVRGATTFSPTSERRGSAETPALHPQRGASVSPASRESRDADTHLVGTDGSTGNQPSSPPRSKEEMPTRSRSARGETEGGNPDRAIERTNEILANLRQKRGEPSVVGPESPATTTFSDANPLNLSAQHLWHQTAPGARKSPYSKAQRAAASFPLGDSSQSHQLSFPPAGGEMRGESKSDPPTTEPSLTLFSLRETIAALESDVQALRDELARTRADLEKTLSAESEAEPRTDPESTILDVEVPYPQPVQTGDPL